MFYSSTRDHFPVFSVFRCGGGNSTSEPIKFPDVSMTYSIPAFRSEFKDYDWLTEMIASDVNKF